MMKSSRLYHMVLAGVRDLEEWDADQIRAYRARKDAE